MTTSEQVREGVTKTRRFIRHSQANEWFSGLLVFYGCVWGLLLLSTPDVFTGPSFRVTFGWAAPQMWGFLMVGSALMFGAAVWFHRDVAWLVVAPVVFIFTAWGGTVMAAIGSNGLPPLASGLGAAMGGLLCALLYDETHGGD